jgi:hypothetical protein
MCEGNLVAIRPGERDPNSFSSMLERIISAMYRVQVVADSFGDLSDMPERYCPGAYVVAEVPRELERLYDDLEAWHNNHEHTPKAKGVQS